MSGLPSPPGGAAVAAAARAASASSPSHANLPGWLLERVERTDDGQVCLKLVTASLSDEQQQQAAALLRQQPLLIDAAALKPSGELENDPLLAAVCETRALRSLQLVCYEMSPADMQRLTDAMAQWPSLNHLLLEGPDLHADDFAHFCASLPASIASLGLVRCDLTPDSLPQLTAALRRMPAVRSLDLSNNKELFKPQADSALSPLSVFIELLLLARPALTELSLGNCGVEDGKQVAALLSAIGEHARQLQKLNLFKWPVSRCRSPNGIPPLSFLSRCTDLQSLSLKECGLNSKDMPNLAALILPRPDQPPSLTRLNLSGNFMIGDAGICSLAEALAGSEIEQLQLERCGLSWSGFHQLLEVLPDMRLRLLDLSFNEQLVQQSLFSFFRSFFRGRIHPHNALSTLLTRCPSLRELRLKRIGMGDANAADLANGVKRRAALTSLDLSGNDHIGAQGMASLLAAVGESCSLQQLCLPLFPPALLPQLLAAIDRNSKLNRVVLDLEQEDVAKDVEDKTLSRRIERGQEAIKAKQQQQQQLMQPAIQQQPQQLAQLAQLQHRQKEAERRALEAEQQLKLVNQQIAALHSDNAAVQKQKEENAQHAVDLQQQLNDARQQLLQSEQSKAACEAKLQAAELQVTRLEQELIGMRQQASARVHPAPSDSSSSSSGQATLIKLRQSAEGEQHIAFNLRSVQFFVFDRPDAHLLLHCCDLCHVLPRYVISFDVIEAAGASFNGSAEQMGPE